MCTGFVNIFTAPKLELKLILSGRKKRQRKENEKNIFECVQQSTFCYVNLIWLASGGRLIQLTLATPKSNKI